MLQKIYWFLLPSLLFINNCCFAQYDEKIISVSLAEQTYGVELDFQWFNGNIVIPIQIEGDSLSFIFDTGAVTLVSQSVKDRYASDAKSKMVDAIDANEQVAGIELINFPSFEIGDLEVKDVPAAVLPDDHLLFTCFGIDGLIGSNWLINTEVIIDYQHKKIWIQSSSGTSYQNQLMVNAQNIPFLEVQIGKEPAFFLFDTGDSSYGTIGRKTLRKSKRNFRAFLRMEGVNNLALNGFSKAQQTDYYLTNQFGKKQFYIAFAKGYENRLGSQILEQGILYLNYRTQTWEITPYKDLPTPKESRFNVFVMPIEGVLRIAQKNTSLKEISIGDRVIAIEGLDAVQLEQLTICQALRGEIHDLILGKTLLVATKSGQQSILVQEVEF